MNHSCNYAVIQFAAHAARNERLNVGLVLFNDDALDIRLSKRIDKVRVLSAALDVEAVSESIMNLTVLDALIREEGSLSPESRLKRLADFAPVQFSGLGSFSVTSLTEYENSISLLLQRLIEPEPAPISRPKKRTSRLLTDLKQAFKRERILAKNGEDISSHRVVANHPVAEGMSAQLVLKNGALHILEAVGGGSDDAAPVKFMHDIAYSALVFEAARMSNADTKTNSRLVYQASAALERNATSALSAAAHQGAELVNWESMEQRTKLLASMTALAMPIEEARGKQRLATLNASTQRKFSLN